MIKQKAYQIAGSNLENFGTALEYNCKKASAECEHQWKGTGEAPGLVIWRIENFKVVPWPKDHYGTFFDHDSYILLNTHGTAPNFDYDIHFWLGEDTAADEAGTAAYKTVELDNYHDMKPREHREVQGHESKLFLSYFPHIHILKGGIASGFKHVTPEEYKPRLLHLRRGVQCVEVALARESLNSSDVFILDAGLNIYQWNGAKCPGVERVQGATICRSIDEDREGKTHITVYAEGDSDVEPAFWQLLGGEGAVKDHDEAVQAAEAAKSGPKKLLSLSDETGKMVFKEVASGSFSKQLLNSSEVFVFDAGEHIFVWIGSGADAAERSKGIGYATEYLHFHHRPPYLPISQVKEGREGAAFNSSFN